MVPSLVEQAALVVSRMGRLPEEFDGPSTMPGELAALRRRVWTLYTSCPACWAHNRGMHVDPTTAALDELTCMWPRPTGRESTVPALRALGHERQLEEYVEENRPEEFRRAWLAGWHIPDYFMEMAALWGSVEILALMYTEFPHPRHQRVGESLWYNCIRGGSVACLLYLLEHGERVPDDATALAAAHGKLDMLKALADLGVRWHPQTLARAYAGGWYVCLRWAHEHGAPWSPSPWPPPGNIACQAYCMAHDPALVADCGCLGRARE